MLLLATMAFGQAKEDAGDGKMLDKQTMEFKDYLPEIHGTIRGKYEYQTETSESRFEVRNARFSVSGNVHPIVAYKAEIDLSDEGSIKMLDAYARVFPVKDQSLQRKAPEHLQHFAVHFPCLSAEMDLTGNPPAFQINKKRRICNDIASKSNFHALLYDISDLRILFRQIIQGIEGEMHRLFIFFYHPGKNFQLTVCSKLNITAENLPAI